jgi:cobalt/nickel transport system permease protein
MRTLGLPRLLVATVSFMYRYLFVIGEEALRLMRARDSRSARLPGQKGGDSLGWRAKVLGHMVGSLFLRTYERSERVYAAMLARGYDGEPRFLWRRAWRATEVVLVVGLVAYLAGVELYARY